jgi:MOSC domain-containing protein YiiM
MMRVVSVNVGRIEDLLWEGRRLRTGFRKVPTAGAVPLSGNQLQGDEQADLEAHGGPRKAVYVYPSEHYAYWAAEIPELTLGWGAFGENLTTLGWLEGEVREGDRVRVGTTELEVTQPRRPCIKMNANFGRPDMIERFHRSVRSGFYLGVVREGEISAGDPIEPTRRGTGKPSIEEVVRPSRTEHGDPRGG